MLGVSHRWLDLSRYHGTGPKFVRVSARTIRYRLSDLESWIAERVRTSTSDTGEAA